MQGNLFERTALASASQINRPRRGFPSGSQISACVKSCEQPLLRWWGVSPAARGTSNRQRYQSNSKTTLVAASSFARKRWLQTKPRPQSRQSRTFTSL